MVNKSKSMIGHDPLAWLKDAAEDTDNTEVKENPVSKAKAKKKAAKKTASKSKAAKDKDMKAKDAASEHVFEIQSVQDISSVTDVYKEMKKLFENETVILDGENVERIDAASLQLILSFIQEAKVNNVDVSWRSPSSALSNSAKLLGMEDALQLNNVA